MKQMTKKTLMVIVACCLSIFMMAQAPQKFNYQGIARDAQGNPLKNQKLALKLTLLPAQDATQAEFEETQMVTTNEFGLYTLQIGNGQVVTGDMKAVKWETGNKYIHVAIDPTGGSNFVDAGTTQLLSVPYALYSDKAGSATESVPSTRATNNYIEKTNGSGVANSTSLLFDNGTNIGLGTTTPTARFQISQNVAAIQEHFRMQNLSNLGAGRFTMYNNGANSYATFTKYGTAYAGNYGSSALYPYANLLAFGNNGPTAGDGLGRFLITNGGNIGMSFYKAGITKLKFHADFTTENVGIGGNADPIARIHGNNTDGTTMDIRLTNNTTGHTATDGLDIRTVGNAAAIMNRENADLNLGTNNSTRMKIQANGNIGVNSNSVPSSALLEVKSTTQGFLPPVMTETEMNSIVAPVAGLTIYNTTTECLYSYNGSYWKSMCKPPQDTIIFSYTGLAQTLQIPAGYSKATIECYGAQGGTGGGSAGGPGGFGAYAKGELGVSWGQNYTIIVGESPVGHLGGYGGGGNGGAPGLDGRGGGGGGASYMEDASANILIIAGGGGGGGGIGCELPATGGTGGVGGGGNGGDGNDAPTPSGVAGGGKGAIGVSGGLPGIGCSGFLGQAGSVGISLQGGAGGNGQTCCCFTTHSDPSGGGGGGGLIGGGGGGGGSAGTVGCSGNDKGAGGGGAGGTSSTGVLGNSSSSQGVQAGNGMVRIILE